MEKAALFSLRASALAGAVLLMGCAHPARELPPDMSNLVFSQRLLPGDTASPEYGLSCMALKVEIATTRDALSHTEAQLRGIQQENQSKGVAGLLIFLPIMLSMEDNETMKNQYRALDEKRERLVRIAQARQCQP